MKKILILSFVLLAQRAHAQSAVATTDAIKKAVISAEKKRFDAQVSKNYAILEQTLSNDLVYTHSNGNTDSKQSFIQSIRDGKSKYDAINVEEQKVRIYGNTAIINGVCMIKAMNNGQTINTHLKYTDVYVRTGNQWQLVTWQSIKLAK
ncbi:nuclear transport factor 2 family protein [Spirosoma sp. SC4-14]|uniref:nuclear transport factor 2 family protein n=1 Tax=Spirosoma sp. SC4-14 TaxID=3128900 RepID=UPI0030CCFD0C